ncbi:hypothetical protein AVEN_73244-1 [Araneus ventricosus]|uniref:Uncharacterized protein n=1 Tax=Araneus ventricosus TaxID=182803 RepID=A0A4Y2F5N3_ARAVE|nr:hypothetical protein AVEN_73244-1 [Araneus ventricosus]
MLRTKTPLYAIPFFSRSFTVAPRNPNLSAKGHSVPLRTIHPLRVTPIPNGLSIRYGSLRYPTGYPSVTDHYVPLRTIHPLRVTPYGLFIRCGTLLYPMGYPTATGHSDTLRTIHPLRVTLIPSLLVE